MVGTTAKPQFETFDADSIPLYNTNRLYVDKASHLLTKWIRRYEKLTGSPWENTATRNARKRIGLDRLKGLNLENKVSSAQDILFLWTARYMTHVERRVSSNSSCDVHDEDAGERTSTSMNSSSSGLMSESNSVLSAETGVSLATREYEEWFQNTSKHGKRSPPPPSAKHRISHKPSSPDPSTSSTSAISVKSIPQSDYIKALERGGLKAVKKLRAKNFGHQQHQQELRNSTNMRPSSPGDPSSVISGLSFQSFESSLKSFKNRPFSPEPRSLMSEISLQSIESSVYIKALEEGGISAVHKFYDRGKFYEK